MDANDAIGLLAAMIEQEGGSYTLTRDSLEAVATGRVSLIAEISDDGQNVVLSLVEEVTLDRDSV